MVASYLVACQERIQAALRSPGTPGEEPAPDGSPLARLVQGLGLRRFERDLWMLALAPELDPAFAERCAPYGSPGPTLGIALRVLEAPDRLVLASGRVLSHYGLVRVEPGPVQLHARLRVDARVLGFCLGDGAPDPEVARTWAPVDPAALQAADDGVRDAARALAARLPAGPDGAPAWLVGGDAARRHLAAALALHLAGRVGGVVPLDALPRPVELGEHLLAMRREALLGQGMVVLSMEDPTPRDRALLRRVLREVQAPVLVLAPERVPVDGRAGDLVTLAPRHRTEAARRWSALLGAGVGSGTPVEAVERAAARLAADFPPDAVDRVTPEGAVSLEAAVASVRRRLTRGAAAAPAPRSPAWEDVVLPPATLAAAEELVAAAEHRGVALHQWGLGRSAGLLALLCGPSGVGKTLLAEACAARLGLRVERVDLSRVVDKYVGETEKHLAATFDAAEQGGTLLLFDEADALFGRRTEVRDSHDRYANLAVGYLLQRVEAFQGVTLLTTNLRSNLDPAFVRRFRYVLEIPFPGPAERRVLWDRALGKSLPRQAIDLDRLARLTVSGATIANIAWRAAIEVAATNAEAVGMGALARAARREFQMAGQPLAESELAGW